MTMPGRQFSSGSDYRFGFIGAENDNEISGDGNSQYHTFRQYSQRLGRYMSLDPLAKSFPWNSPFVYAENRVIDGIDLEGREWTKSIAYDIHSGVFNVEYKVKVQIINASHCEMSVNAQQEIMLKTQSTFATTYSQFDKDNNVNYSANIEYEFLNDPSQIGEEGTITIMFRETVSNDDGAFIGGKTLYKGGDGGTQTNLLTINTHVDGESRDLIDIVRTTVHELGHSGGLDHPWVVSGNSPEVDVMQGVASDDVVKTNIMNSGQNPIPKNRYHTGSGIDATKSTPGQTKKIGEAIKNDLKK